MISRVKGLLEGLLVLLFFAALVIPMYYPISLHPGSMLPDKGDPSLYVWIVAWDLHKFLTGLSGFFDANIFWPYKDTLAYTDHLIGLALMAAPVYFLTGNIVLAWNSTTIASFILSGLAMYLLCREFRVSRGASLIAGVIFTFCPWRYAHYGHTTFYAFQWGLFALIFLHREIDNPRWGRALLYGFFFAFQGLSCLYLGAYLGVTSAVVLVYEFIRRGYRLPRALFVQLGTAMAIALLLLTPILTPFFRVSKEQGVKRTERDCVRLSADPFDYLAAPPHNRIYGATGRIFKSRLSYSPCENQLFPGIVPVLLGLAGLFFYRGKRPAKDSRGRGFQIQWERHQAIYFTVAITAFVLSLGPTLHVYWKMLYIPLPYKLLYHFVPGFAGMRGVSRFACVFMLGLAVLAAFGFDRVAGALRGPVKRSLAAMAFMLVILAEYFSSPVPHAEVPTGESVPRVYQWLAKQSPVAVVAELPQCSRWPGDSKDFSEVTGFMYAYYSAFHSFQPTINGQAAFLPPSQKFIWSVLSTFPSPESINLLRYLGVSFVVLHTDKYLGDEGKGIAGRASALASDLRAVGSFGPDLVYQVPGTLGPGSRLSMEGLAIKDAFLPARLRPYPLMAFSIELSDQGKWPVISTKLMEVELTVSEKGRNRAPTRQREKINVTLLPGQSRWYAFNVPGPTENGTHRLEVRVRFPELPGVDRSFAFDLEVGDFKDSRTPGVLKAEFTVLSAPAEASPNQAIPIQLKIKNAGDTLWLALPVKKNSKRGVIGLKARGWYRAGQKQVNVHTPSTLGLGRSLAPGEETTVTLSLWAPEAPGDYLVKLDLEDRDVGWFEDKGSTPLWIPVSVRIVQ